MVHTKFGDSVPSAIVVSRNPRTSSLDEMKLYEGKYFFLENGQEFQIKMFNPLTESIAARISLNDNSSDSMLIIRPGESVTIDRFLDDKNKMLFETYEYDSGNGAAEKAVSNNGKLKIEFFNEQPKWELSNRTVFGSPNSSGNADWLNPTWTTSNGTYTTNTTTHDINGLNYGNLDLGNIGTSHVYSSQVSDTTFNECDTSGIYNSVPLSDVKAFNEKSFDAFKEASEKLEDIKETGRVEMGEESDQEFKTVEKRFCALAFHTVEYDLKPVSEHKNIVQTEIREYCTECGYRQRQKSWKFCPKCGTKN